MKEQIIQLKEKGFSHRQIAEKLGCSKSTVSYHIGTRTNKPKGKGDRLVCKCGGKKSFNSVTCKTCLSEKRFNEQELRTLKDVSLEGNARVRWSHLRDLARRKLDRNNVVKKCSVCDFDLFVDCCHIKPISEFDEECFVKEVNSLDNLIYLCPNHHKMLDKGLLKIECLL